MITGIGTDIVEVKRIEKLLDDEKFLDKIFTKKEKEYFESKKNNSQSIAAGFAGKEAVSKAFGTGISKFSFRDIEILHNEKNAPYVVLHNGAKKICDGDKVWISLTHEKGYAMAFAVTEK